MLSSVPGKVQESSSEPTIKPRQIIEKRTFSFEQERQLATTFAFLSGISDNSEHVTAVCVEEVPSTQGCKILVAINKSSPEKRNHLLQQIHFGFEGILGKLKKLPSATRKEAKDIEEAVFSDIVALCRKRIIHRIRLRKAKGQRGNRGRYIGLNLREFLGTPWLSQATNCASHLPKSHLLKYKARSEALLSHFDEFESEYRAVDPKHEDLVDFVRHIACFMSKVPLGDLLSCLTEDHMASTARTRLFGCLSKIARFRECAAFLCGMASKILTLAHASVNMVYLPTMAFDRCHQETSTVTIDDMLARTMGDEGDYNLPEHVKRQLQEDQLHKDVEEVLETRVLRPRIIAANKDACYLCSTIIRLHGQFVVPKTHGRLYAGWRLPATANFDSLQRKLNQQLEQTIREIIWDQIQLKKTSKTIHPNESTIFALHLSTSSATLAAASCLALKHHARHTASLVPIPEDPVQIEATDAQCSLTTHGNRNSEADMVEAEGSSEGSKRLFSPSAMPSGERISTGKSYDDQPSNQNEEHNPSGSDGESVRDQIDSLCSGNDSVTEGHSVPDAQRSAAEPIRFSRGRVRFKNIELFLDAPSPNATLRLLSLEQSREVLRSKAELVFDVSALACSTESPCLKRDTDGAAYFAFGKQVVRVDTTAI